MADSSLSARSHRLNPSPTLAMTARAKQMAASGARVVSFAAGEPDFNTPEPIVQAAIDALNRGETKYTPSAGTPALRQAVVEKLKRENQIIAKPSEVVVSCGAKHSVCNALLALLNPGDEVILLAPYWMTYADQVRLADGEPVVVQTKAEDGFLPDIDAVKAAITPKTKAIIINSPCNPTGAAMDRRLLKEIAALAIRFGFWVISDEIYERLIYGHEHQSIAALGSEIAERTITITGVSKTYAMTGWRIGFAHAPEPVAAAMSKIQDQVTSNPTSFAQAGAVAALNMPDEAVLEMRDTFKVRRDLVLRRLRAIPGVTVNEPQGAFYVMPDITAFLGGAAKTDVELADLILDQAHVACVAGSHFIGPGHLRLSYAASELDIEEGVGRLAKILPRLAP